MNTKKADIRRTFLFETRAHARSQTEPGRMARARYLRLDPFVIIMLYSMSEMFENVHLFVVFFFSFCNGIVLLIHDNT